MSQVYGFSPILAQKQKLTYRYKSLHGAEDETLWYFVRVNFKFLVRCGKAQNLDTISEIGIFGIYLHETEHKNDSGIIINNNDGYLVRTKPAQSNVGGVNVGGACIDSLYLVE